MNNKIKELQREEVLLQECRSEDFGFLTQLRVLLMDHLGSRPLDQELLRDRPPSIFSQTERPCYSLGGANGRLGSYLPEGRFRFRPAPSQEESDEELLGIYFDKIRECIKKFQATKDRKLESTVTSE